MLVRNTSSQCETDEAGQPVIISWLSWLSKVVLLVKPGGETDTLVSHTRDQGLVASAVHTIG